MFRRRNMRVRPATKVFINNLHDTQLGMLTRCKARLHHHFDASGTSNAMFDELASPKGL